MKTISKILFLVLILGMLATSAFATNLVPNSGFENVTGSTFDDWTGTYNISTVSHTGTYSALISDGGGADGTSLAISSRTFATAPGTYEFGAWFSFGISADVTSGWPDDRPGISAVVNPITAVDPTYPNQIVSVPSGVPTLDWTLDTTTGIYWSEWTLLGGTFEVSDPTTTRLTLYVQNYDHDYIAHARVDDAFVSAPVPEPSTILLLGSGLLWLGWYGRKRKKA